jgi:hypothetical protein
MIELKIGDLLRIQEKETKENYLSVVRRVDEDDSNVHRYFTTNCFVFNENFIDDDNKYEIIEAWRYDKKTGNFLRIYNKEGLINPFECGKGMEAPSHDIKPADVPYDTYIALEHENEELRNVIVELNKKIYRRDDGE